MKTFKNYLQESIQGKKYDFRIKIAGDVSSEQEEKMKTILARFAESGAIGGFKKSKTPIQATPLDFPQVTNCEVHIYEVSLDYPTTQQELTEYLSKGLSVSKQYLVVRSPNEPSEEYQKDIPKREGALLNDPDYKEAGSPQFEDYYGDKYNSGFVKELNDILKLQRKARGEEIPTESTVKYNTDSDANTKSILVTAPDPRK